MCVYNHWNLPLPKYTRRRILQLQQCVHAVGVFSVFLKSQCTAGSDEGGIEHVWHIQRQFHRNQIKGCWTTPALSLSYSAFKSYRLFLYSCGVCVCVCVCVCVYTARSGSPSFPLFRAFFCLRLQQTTVTAMMKPMSSRMRKMAAAITPTEYSAEIKQHTKCKPKIKWTHMEQLRYEVTRLWANHRETTVNCNTAAKRLKTGFNHKCSVFLQQT